MDTSVTKTTGKQIIRGQSGPLFIDDGGEAGLPVVLVHSFGGSSAHWKTQLEHLRKNRRALAFDLRGHGQSGIPSNNNSYNVSQLADDIAAVADSLGLDRFVLVGHSMGGSAAIEYAGAHPEKVAGLMLVGTPGKTPDEQSKPIISSLESEQYDKVMQDYMKRLLTNAKPAVDKQVMDGMSKLSKPASVSIIKALFEYDPRPALKKYPGPKLVVSATAEEQPNALSKQLPDIPFKVIEGTSHWLQMDKPDEFNRVLDEFLKRIENPNK